MPRRDYSEGSVAAGPGTAATAPRRRTALALAAFGALPFGGGAGGGAEGFLPGPVGRCLNVILCRLSGNIGPAFGFTLDAFVFFPQTLVGPASGILFGFATEALDQLFDPFGRFAAHLLGAFHDTAVDVSFDLGDPLAGKRFKFVGMRLSLRSPFLGLAGALVGRFNPVLGFPLRCLPGLLGEALGDFLEGRGAELGLPAIDYRSHLAAAGRLLVQEIRLDREQANLRAAANTWS